MTTNNARNHGMSDAELEAACRPSLSGLAPWTFWASELYSLGKCMRIFGSYPRLLPLFVYSDHGTGLHSRFYPHELANNSRVYLTFHPLKAKRYQGHSSKRVIRIQHPWIFYRRSQGLERLSETIGTLAFITHHAPGFKWEQHTTSTYFETLRSLPDKCQPVVLCLHMHDINAGLHKELRRLGFPMVTAGNTSSLAFVDNFYDLVKRFSYATSPSWGSQVAYCIELGLPYFFLGDRPRLLNLSHKEVALGEVDYQDEYHREYEKRAELLFSVRVDKVTPEQTLFVSSLLGLNSEVTRAALSWILWREFFHHWRQWWPTWLRPVWGSLRKHGILGLLQRVRKSVRSSAR